jgi:hypothetical protein
MRTTLYRSERDSRIKIQFTLKITKVNEMVYSFRDDICGQTDRITLPPFQAFIL